MHLNYTKPIEGKVYHLIRGFRDKSGKSTSKSVRRFGTLEEIRNNEGVKDAWRWILNQVKLENSRMNEGRRSVDIKVCPDKLLEKDEQRLYNIGYLILQKLYYELGIGLINDSITRRSGFKYDLDEVVRQIVLGRILWPCSKLKTYGLSSKLALVKPVSLHQYYRSLLVISDNLEYVQQRLFHYTKNILKRDTSIIYYDCTNFFFESTKETELRKPGASKENRRTPIVQFGIFMDADGLPLAFCINPGNTNEQTTLAPLERMIGEKMNINEFIMCTDAGLSSFENRLENDTDSRKFITVQSIKTLPEKGDKTRSGGMKSWALEPTGWRLPAEQSIEYDIRDLDLEKDRDRIFYKERWYKTVKDGETLEQRIIVSYSPKYREYQRNRRAINLEHAEKAVRNGNAGPNSKDFRKYITTMKVTSDGEIIEKVGSSIDWEKVKEEEKYDGFYAVCTNLEKYEDKHGKSRHTIAEILEINRARWEIEESFRIMKLQMKARPVYLQNDKAIKAHFALCFLSLFILRVLEHRLPGVSTDSLLESLRTMDALKVDGEGYIPTFTRTDITDTMFDISGFRLDTQIIMLKKLKSINALTKQR